MSYLRYIWGYTLNFGEQKMNFGNRCQNWYHWIGKTCIRWEQKFFLLRSHFLGHRVRSKSKVRQKSDQKSCTFLANLLMKKNQYLLKYWCNHFVLFQVGQKLKGLFIKRKNLPARGRFSAKRQNKRAINDFFRALTIKMKVWKTYPHHSPPSNFFTRGSLYNVLSVYDNVWRGSRRSWG